MLYKILYEIKEIFTYRRSKHGILRQLWNVKRKSDKVKSLFFLFIFSIIVIIVLVNIYIEFVKTYPLFFNAISILSLLLYIVLITKIIKKQQFKLILFSKSNIILKFLFIVSLINLYIAIPQTQQNIRDENLKISRKQTFTKLLNNAHLAYKNNDFENAYKNYKLSLRFGDLINGDKKIFMDLFKLKIKNYLKSSQYRYANLEYYKVVDMSIGTNNFSEIDLEDMKKIINQRM